MSASLFVLKPLVPKVSELIFLINFHTALSGSVKNLVFFIQKICLTVVFFFHPYNLSVMPCINMARRITKVSTKEKFQLDYFVDN